MSWLTERLGEISSSLNETAPPERMQKKAVPEEAPRSFSNIYDMMGSVGSILGYLHATEDQQDLLARYRDYDDMGQYSLLSTALDIYADDATKIDLETQKTVWVKSEDKKLEAELTDLYDNHINVEEISWSIARTVAQYGNDFGEILYSGEDGVVGFTVVPPRPMRRIQDIRGTLLGYAQSLTTDGQITIPDFKRALDKLHEATKNGAQFQVGGFTGFNFVPFDPWEIIHFRMLSYQRTPYGVGLLDPARWAWRRLVLLEDAAIVYKLTRAPAKWAFYIDVTGVAPNQVGAWLEKAKNQFTSKKFIGSDGKIDFKNHPLGQQDTFFIPSNGGKNATQIEMLSGADSQAIDDLEYFRTQLIGAIKVPRTYLGLEDGDSRASLSQQDSRFAASTGRLQRVIVNGFRQIGEYHLMAKGIDPNSSKWSVHMTSPSAINELAQIEAKAAKADLAARMGDLLPREEILKNILGYSKEETAALLAAKKKELKDQADFEMQQQTAGLQAQYDIQSAAMPEESIFGIRGNPLDEKVNAEIRRQFAGDEDRINRFERDHNTAELAKIMKEVVALRKELRRSTILSNTRRKW